MTPLTSLRIAVALGGLLSPLARAVEAGKGPAGTVLADDKLGANLLQTSLGLLVVLAVIAVAAWGVKRFGNLRGGVQGQMKVVGGVSLGTRERVVLLQVGEQQLVLGVAPGQIRTLHVLDQPLTPGEQPDATPADTDTSFAARLKTAIGNGGAK